MNSTPHVPGILSKLVEDKEAAYQAETATWGTQCQSKNMVYWRELHPHEAGRLVSQSALLELIEKYLDKYKFQ
jgi:hypothetical protein